MEGRAVIRRHLPQLDHAEKRVNEINEALDHMLSEWRRLPDGGELVVEWVTAKRARTRSTR